MSNWWDALPRSIYSTLDKVKTSQSWYDVYKLHEWLYAIYEGGQYDEALMYLVIGDEEAAVIDGGTGIGHLDKLVEELTEKPYSLVLTHTHNDHIGGCKDFEDIAVFDDVMSWESAAKGLGHEKMGEIISEDNLIRELPEDFDPDNYYATPYTVTKWLYDGDAIDLGGRKLEVIYTPGHSSNHICLLDRDGRYLWTGDHFYTGGITTYLPGGNHIDFIKSSQKLVEMLPEYDTLLPAHNEPLVDASIMKELLKGAEDIIKGNLKEYEESYSIAVDYSIRVKKYRFSKFFLITRADI